MDRKIISTLILVIILLLIVVGGSLFSFVHQSGIIDEKEQKLKSLNLNAYNTEDLLDQLRQLKKREAELDSILSLRKFNIPVGLFGRCFRG